MAKKKSTPKNIQRPTSRGSIKAKPVRSLKAPLGSGRQPKRQTSSKPRQPKAEPKRRVGVTSRTGNASARELYKLFQEAERKSGSKVSRGTKKQDARKSKNISHKSAESKSKIKRSVKKTGDSARHKKATGSKVDKRTKEYKEKEKWRRYGHLIRLTRLRSRLWKLAPDDFGSYADTLELAKCMLEKNDGKIPRSNTDLLALMSACLDEVGLPGEVSPVRRPPEIDIIGRWSFFELDELMISLPYDFPYDITSDLSLVPRFKRVEYNYPDTFKEYVEYVNRKVKEGQLDKYHEIEIEWRYNQDQKSWEIWVYELLDSGFVSDVAPLGIPRRPRPGAPNVTNTEEELSELEQYKEESKSAYDERQQLIDYVGKLVEQKNKLFEEYKYMMERGDKTGAAIVGDELGDVRRQIRALRTRITLLKKGKKKKKK